MPKVQEVVKAIFGKEGSRAVNPDEAVAIGGKNVCFLVHPYLGMIELVEA